MVINEVAAIPGRLVLVLDDYHLITNRTIHEGLAFLLEQMPPGLHLVIASRVDPPLPLHLLRGRRQLVELHAADLRFTADEAAAFLNEVMGLGLSADKVAALARRTEGWITGLQLAALSMAGRDDVAGFVSAFAGSHRYVLDYLAEEVLHRQPPAVQTFLLQTSILERLTAPLCEAVTGQAGGHETLEKLERGNLFVVPLDDERRWYRYHHLFAEVLRAFLQRSAGAEGLAGLHRRAAGWYEAQGLADDAFKHAMAARDLEGAARIIDENWVQVGHAGEMNTVLGWLASMPQEVVREQPALSMAYAWALWLTGQMDAVEPHLDAADERWAQQAAADGADPNWNLWRAGIVALRTQLARNRGQLAEAMGFARETLALAAPGDALLQSYGHLGLAHASRELGDYDQALPGYAQGMALMRVAGNLAAASLAAFYLCRLLQIQGRQSQATEVVAEALAFMEARGMADSPACGLLYVASAGLLCERHELAEAGTQLQRGLDLGRLGGHHDFVRNALIAMARLRLARGDPSGALAAMEEAEGVTPAAEMPLVGAEVAAHKARVWIAQGRLAEAARWAAETAGRRGQDNGYTRRVEATTRARVLLAGGDLGQALDLLAACREKAQAGGSRGWLVEIEILRALVLEGQGQRAEALAALGRALAEAEAQGAVQVFVDEGAPMAGLLAALLAARPGELMAYTRRLLATLGGADQDQAASPLMEPLTAREREVLALMAAGLSNRQICEALVISIGTVKAHLHNIYGKLGVQNRTEAAARARELEIL
jgi:LuxR family maltose regulon positive regulatory protein